MSRGVPLQGVTHIGLWFFTMPGLFWETSPNKPVMSHTGYTHRGGWCEQSEYMARSPDPWWCQRVAKWAVVLVAVHIQWSGRMVGLQVWPVVQQGSSVGWSEFWVLITHQGQRSHSYQCQIESYLKCPVLGFWVFWTLPEGCFHHTPLP